jgi:hypothetical protein
MPRGPKGEKRPADVIGNAVHVMRIATGEIDETATTEDGKNAAAVALGRMGGNPTGRSSLCITHRNRKEPILVHQIRSSVSFANARQGSPLPNP